jgi:acyl-CoA synthetase (AMP-forming)/AMP-acid ligase II
VVRADLDWGTLARLGRSLAERFGDGEAVVDGTTRLSWRELEAAGGAAAQGMVAAGVEPGHRVAIWAPNSAEWVTALLGVHQAGAVVVPINTRLRGGEAADILRRSRARLLLTVTGFLGNDYLGMLAGHDLPDLAGSVVLRGDAPPGTGSWPDFLAAGAVVDPREVERRAAAVRPDDPSDVIFTSGTTGAPKGVVATHAQTLRAYGEWASVVGLERADRYLMVNPMFHTFGYKAGIVASMLAGATMVPLPVFDPDAVLATVPAERITVLPGPPTLYQTLLAHPRLGEADLSTLRLAVTGAASIPLDLVRRMGEELGFETVLTAYGLTEATGYVTACRRGDPPEIVAGTSGRAISDVEVRVVEGAGGEVPPGSPGEIVCRGYHVMQGYLDDPEGTAQAIDGDGWLHTGDIGVMDADGNLRVTDRLKDMFIVGGFNAYPAEIESLLCGHPGVAQAAVVGVPDERLGEVGVAFVVPVAGAPPEPPALVEWAREHMANYKVPRRVHVVEALPLNASGKVLKHELRRRAAGEVG